jgi:tetratricopeptide (TPR) repeat protein
MTLNNLAGMHARSNEYDKAIAVSQEALGIRLASLGADHPDTAASRVSLAKGYLEVKRWAEAKAELELAFAVRKLTPGVHDGYPYVTCCDLLVRACEGLGQMQEALDYALLRAKQPSGNEGALRNAQWQVTRLQAKMAKASGGSALTTASLDIQSGDKTLKQASMPEVQSQATAEGKRPSKKPSRLRRFFSRQKE